LAQPVLGSQIQQDDKSHQQKWQEEFGKKSLEIISKKWNDQLLRNKQEFD